MSITDHNSDQYIPPLEVCDTLKFLAWISGGKGSWTATPSKEQSPSVPAMISDRQNKMQN